MVKSTLNTYRVLWLCHKHLTPKYRQLVSDVQSRKRVHHLRSAREIRAFLQDVQNEANA
jgi:hypothetical protein